MDPKTQMELTENMRQVKLGKGVRGLDASFRRQSTLSTDSVDRVGCPLRDPPSFSDTQPNKVFCISVEWLPVGKVKSSF